MGSVSENDSPKSRDVAVGAEMSDSFSSGVCCREVRGPEVKALH